MKFIPKVQLVEGMAANPLDKQISNEQDVTKLAQEGILTAVAAETDAINQYTQISDLIFTSEDWFKQLAEPVIEDIIAEEKKHLGQLTELVSKLPAYQEDMEKGEKETETGEDVGEAVIEESVDEKASSAFTKFDFENILDVLREVGVPFETVEKLEDSEYPAYIYAEDVDKLLASLNLAPEVLEQAEQKIIEEADFEKNMANIQQEIKRMDLEKDLQTLTNLIEDPDNDNYIVSFNIRQKLNDLINEIKNNPSENI